ncbi:MULTISPECIES: DUF3240 family protein [Idiomarina]|uniref:DUF3240 family protein n=1 Tax=Idiomarinaceae TaxID=267893 RepID=UPI00129AE520|nr:MULTISPECIES: DUF3240 family protein [Idiomarina]MDX1525814.1 DUF3240 family protein [Pseudidiomarina maritima]MRJ41228.1 DUF3240 domain-containing protein [Idiomarina sp. FeN1]NCU56393.1 DUF3240 domain-containing protein [Idiomarina sp. FenA--70]NCU59412.1 DUF3240 domain-containing protein [Idiomarina sp. FenBw--71]UUN12586.1 DUF3240 family protein [Idiomarina loihiensis]
MSEYELLHVIFPAKLRAHVVDVLLADEQLSGFSLAEIDGHSRQNSQLDRLEQVVGYRRMLRLEVMVTEPEKQRVLTLLKQLKPASAESLGVRFYTLPISSSGHL